MERRQSWRHEVDSCVIPRRHRRPVELGELLPRSRGGPHNLYSDTDSLYALTPEDHPGAPPVQFGYLDDGQVFAGEPGRNVSFSIGSIDIEWTWNDDEQRYERSQEGDEHVDKTYGRIGAENVILLGVDYRPSSIDRNSPEAITLGSGLVTVFSNGEYVSGTWERELEVFPFELTLDNEQTIQLTPGQTWSSWSRSTQPAKRRPSKFPDKRSGGFGPAKVACGHER